MDCGGKAKRRRRFEVAASVLKKISRSTISNCAFFDRI
jgi:hypothetical protein